MMQPSPEPRVTLLSPSASLSERRALQRLSRERGALWSDEEIDALLQDGVVALCEADGATIAAIGLEPHPEREDAARVALLWEPRPFDHALTHAMLERAAQVCREHALVAICAEVDAAQADEVELFTGLGFAVIEFGGVRLATAEERAWIGARAPLELCTPTTLELGL